jgi:REP element-mobilizing transposase RayT
MGRARRLEYPGAFYHVMSRGNRGQAIYRRQKDLSAFLDCLGEACERYGLAVHSFCLMTNHYHLVVETPHGNLSAAMHWINSAYARRFNRVHEQRGHLFQSRYKALLVDADTYLTWLSRYIHLNPVRARMTAAPGAYRWSSYRAFVDESRIPGWLQTGLVLSRFGQLRSSAQAAYRLFVEGAPEGAPDAHIARCLSEGETLGSESFLDGLEKLLGREKLPSPRRPPPRLAIDAVLEAASACFDIPMDSLLEKGHKRNLARDLAIYLAHRLCGLSGRDLGAHFGGIRPAAVSMRCRAVREALPWDADLRTHLLRIEAHLAPPPER